MSDMDIDAELLGNLLEEEQATTETTTTEKKEKKRKNREEKEKKRKKKKRDEPKRSRFVDDAAMSGSEDEDDSMDGEADGLEGEEYENTDYIKNHKVDRDFFKYGGTDEEIAAQIERNAKYNTNNKGAAAVAAQNEAHRYATSRLPRPTDPKVFAVKCRPGMARTLVARIVNKCYQYRIGNNHEKRKVDLGIISCFSVDHIKEYIYLESHRQLFVENALNGLEGLFRFKLSVVDPQELMQLMEYQKDGGDQLKPGHFVRMRQQPYKMDLGQVVKLEENGKYAVCKIVPREDFVNKPYVKVPRKNMIQMEQKFFSADLAIGAQTAGNRTRWGDLTFDQDGYILKTVSARMLFSGKKMVPPSLQELKVFLKGDKNKILEAAPQSDQVDRIEKTDFAQHDVVRVASGQLTGVVGKLVELDVDRGTGFVAPLDNPAMKFKTTLVDVVKHFEPGSRVVVERGKHANVSGVVLHTTRENTVVFVTSGGETQYEVHCNDCKQSNLVVSGAHSFSTWKIFDLVLMTDGLTVGCIIQLNEGKISIVTANNGLLKISPSDIKQTIRARVKVADRWGNILSRGEEIAVTGESAPPELRGVTGRVEQLYHKTAWAVCNKRFQNSGLFAVPVDSVSVVGGRSKLRVNHLQPKELPYLERKAHPAKKAENVTPSARQTHAADEDWDASSSYWQ